MQISDTINEYSKEKLPLVSVVTPAYNAERYIEDTIKSVINQTYPYIEHIIIDDGSTDETPKILQKFEKLYNLKWFSKKNEGQAVTLNKCIDLAQGELVVILNADDVLFYKEEIADIVQYFERNNKIDIVYGHMAIIDEKNKLLKIWYTIPWFSYDRLLRYHFAYFICYRREILRKFEFDPTLDFVMDYEQALRMARHGIKFGCLNKILLAYRRHLATKSMSKRNLQIAETKKVQKLYGYKFNITSLIMRLIDYLLLFGLKVYGAITITNLYSHPEKFNLAFSIKFDSYWKTIVRQIIPFVS
jgi:glycosyltransferase involved in cell wall biosynthesis